MDSNIHQSEYINFQKYWLVFKRRWIPATAVFTTIVGLSLIAALSSERIYEAEAELLIKTDRNAKLIGLEDSTREIKGLTADSDPLATEARILKSRPIVEKLIQELDLRNDDGKLLKSESVISGLKVKPVTGTDFLHISYTDKDPEQAKLIVNKAIALYVEDHTLNNRSETSSARKFISQQLPKLEANVKEAEANLRSFQNQNRIASLTEETSANISSLSDVASQIDETEAELEDINARYNALSSQLNISSKEAAAISSLSESLAVKKALEQLQNVKISLANRRNYLSDNAPQIIALKEQEADIAALLDRQIENTLGPEQSNLIKNVNILSLGTLKQDQIAEFANLGLEKDGLEKKLQALRNSYNTYQEKSDQLPRLQEQQRELERRLEAAQSTYQTLLGKLQETQIAEQQNVGNVRIVSEAVVPEEPVGPSRKLMVGGAGVLGGLLSIATAFLLDIRDRSIKNTNEIEEMLPYVLQGVIPDHDKIPAKKQFVLPERTSTDIPNLAAANISNPFISEAYHNIQINLKLLDETAANKVIVVTSATSGEGKSSVSANLAIAKAYSGQKVLLIDGDLRRPNQHKLWELSNETGLTDVLNQNLEWQDAMYPVMSNLDIMTSGTIPAHPIALLNSSSMEALVASVPPYYDCILIDTPPLVGLADSKILGKLADGLLFVVRPGIANYGEVTAAQKLLAATDFNVLGLVANGVDFSKELYGHSYYYLDKKSLEAAS